MGRDLLSTTQHCNFKQDTTVIFEKRSLIFQQRTSGGRVTVGLSTVKHSVSQSLLCTQKPCRICARGHWLRRHVLTMCSWIVVFTLPTGHSLSGAYMSTWQSFPLHNSENLRYLLTLYQLQDWFRIEWKDRIIMEWLLERQCILPAVAWKEWGKIWKICHNTWWSGQDSNPVHPAYE